MIKTTLLISLGCILGGIASYTLLTQSELGYSHLESIPIKKLSFADSSEYTGELDPQGKLSGQGKITWADGFSYKGEFADGLIHGSGVLKHPDIYLYKGQFQRGLKHGQGEITYTNGDNYIGQFQNNEPSGEGTWLVPGNYTYTGEVKVGLFHGEGAISYEYGDHYTGQFKNGELHGQGKYDQKNLGIYEGEFVEGEFTGEGRFTSDTYGNHQGQFNNWLPKGQGIRSDNEGNQWIGDFDGWHLDGEGEYKGIDGSRYVGNFSNGIYHGHGKLINSDGNVYEGSFDYGQKDGRGQYWFTKVLDGIKTFKGIWKQGKLKEGGPKTYSSGEVAEHAIYQQQDLLKESLRQLKQNNTPDKKADNKYPKLFLLTIAGWGKEEVFRREVDFIQKQFAELYNTETRSINLVNSRRDLSRPLATITSIQKSIITFSEVMDKEKDILFIYATSHGEENKGFSLGHKGLSLLDLQVNQLKESLDSSGIKHKVVVISSCYSGQFVEGLKDDNSLIMSASDPESTSFGCSDENDFTYFGRAYFSESLSEADSFEHAFHSGKALIEQWEKEEGLSPSNPMIHVGKNIKPHLNIWRSSLQQER